MNTTSLFQVYLFLDANKGYQATIFYSSTGSCLHAFPLQEHFIFYSSMQYCVFFIPRWEQRINAIFRLGMEIDVLFH
jgi:hypothetical protein